MNRLIVPTLIALLFSASAHAEPVPWNLDPMHSQIGFNVRHLGFAKVHGEFKKFSAKAEADAKTGKLTKLEAEADAKSVDTGVEKRDNHLRSDDFFAAEQFPTIKLEMKNIKWKGKTFTATTALTMRGNTKDVKFDGELLGLHSVNFGQGPQMRAGYEAHAKVNRKDFGLKFAGVAEGIALVADEVEISLEAEFWMPENAPATTAAAPVAQPAAATASAKPAAPSAPASPAAALKATPVPGAKPAAPATGTASAPTAAPRTASATPAAASAAAATAAPKAAASPAAATKTTAAPAAAAKPASTAPATTVPAK